MRSGNLVCALHTFELENQIVLDPLRLKTLANKARATAQSLTTAGISNQEAGQQLLVVSMVQKVSYPYAHCKNARGIYRKIAFAKMFTSNYYIYFIVYIYIYV